MSLSPFGCGEMAHANFGWLQSIVMFGIWFLYLRRRGQGKVRALHASPASTCLICRPSRISTVSFLWNAAFGVWNISSYSAS